MTTRRRIFHAFVDGACRGNHLKDKSFRRASYGIWFSDNHWTRAEPIEPPHTNNRAELTGLVTLLEGVLGGKTDVTSRDDLRVYVDNMYMRNAALKWIPKWKKNKWMTGANMPVKNKDLMLRLDACMVRFCDEKRLLDIAWVKAHRKKEPVDKKSDDWFQWDGNRRADELATGACEVKESGKRVQ